MTLSTVKTASDLAKLLDVKPTSLTYFAYIIPSNKKYSSFSINKKGGGSRKINSPTRGLKNIQRKLYKEIELFYSPRSCVHGYIKEKSIVTNAYAHKNQRWLGRIDIKSFYPSIHTGRVIGLFRSQPFNLPRDIAVLLAKICTHENELPQGAPTSPVISNLIARGVDSQFGVLARENKCYYTRYADDIFISTNQRVYPAEILSHNKDGTTQLGEAAKQVFKDVGFEVNPSKLSLKDKSRRQIVTGIVVNESPNTPKEYVREIRTMLYVWERYGLTSAESHWRSKIDNKNRGNPAPPSFSGVLKGKLSHLAAVKGRADPVYLKFAKRLAKLDENFSIDPKTIVSAIANEIRVFVEGKTDILHLEAALAYFHSKGEYDQIKIVFPDNKNGEGDDALSKLCKSLSSSSQNKLTICVFDSDNPKFAKEMKGSATDYKDHGNNVFSLVIPTPSFRKNNEACIEYYYQDEDLMLKDENGRRIYLRSEFDEKNGTHRTETGVVCLHPKKKTLIVDSDVIDVAQKKNIAMAKCEFAKNIKEAIKPFDGVNFDEFSKVFETIQKLHAEYNP